MRKIQEIQKTVITRIKRDDLLYMLVQLGIAGIAVAVPPVAAIAFVLHALEKQEKKKQYSGKQIRNAFYSLRRRGLLSIQSKAGKTIFSLSPEAERIIKYKEFLKQFELKRQHIWSGIWYVIVFDIDNQRTVIRNAFRALLKNFGFFCLQKSVWVYPHDCTKEIEFIKSFFNIPNDSAQILTCTSISFDEELRSYFRI